MGIYLPDQGPKAKAKGTTASGTGRGPQHQSEIIRVIFCNRKVFCKDSLLQLLPRPAQEQGRSQQCKTTLTFERIQGRQGAENPISHPRSQQGRHVEWAVRNLHGNAGSTGEPQATEMAGHSSRFGPQGLTRPKVRNITLLPLQTKTLVQARFDPSQEIRCINPHGRYPLPPSIA